MNEPLNVERRVIIKGTCQDYSGSYPNGKRREFTEHHNYYPGCLRYWMKRLNESPKRDWHPEITEVYVEQRYTTPWTTVDANELV